MPDAILFYTFYAKRRYGKLFRSRTQSRLAVRNGKKSPNQEIGLGNRGRLKVLNDTKLILNVTHVHLGPIWCHSEITDVPYCPNQFLGWDFFCRFLHQDGSSGGHQILSQSPHQKCIPTQPILDIKRTHYDLNS